ncbi:leucine-rich repeat receptor protein kinase HPCA1 isoform X3 [Cryptomeria japonica]|uniref:leucine-rich repeat receptor protein kinase HPCA1 isoform X3 n=1 Tax=Cryptomeria japonica TaxID=3369 RepID=UPI0025AB9476|nr:leucine-rich repeat receptor protein kinase HPCA1 isoform X3 [Cryptomeria japonica]
METQLLISSFLVLAVCFASWGGVESLTKNEDLVNLNKLKLEWKDTVPPNWRASDPCGSHWDGVNCTWNSQVTSLKLSTMGLKGILPSAIGSLSGLETLDVSYNKDLTGSIPSSLGNLINLKIMLMIGCSFSGQIPNELGNLLNLNFLALNSNGFTGAIPPALGNLSQLHWLDLADNQLSGSLPVSNTNENGLDKLHDARHFHLNRNKLTGTISPNLFHSTMKLVHLLLDGNAFTGEIPSTLELVESLEVLRLDRNSLSGSIPSNIRNLRNVSELNFRNNTLNGTFKVTSNVSRSLVLIDLENNKIIGAQLQKAITVSCRLVGNPACNLESALLWNTSACEPYYKGHSYSTPLTHCRDKICSADSKPNPRTCQCQIPYEGKLKFRAPSFSDLNNASRFMELETTLQTKLGADSVFVRSANFDDQNYLTSEVQIFPVNKTGFRRSEIIGTGFMMGSQNYKAPSSFGTTYFIGDTYFVGNSVPSNSLSSTTIIVLSITAAVLIMMIACMGFYALVQKRRADGEIKLHKPFAGWESKEEQGTSVPNLKGARMFSYMELEKATNRFAQMNEIGSGAYGKVYKGILSGGEMVAIKRANQASLKDRKQFKNEIELLSRVHHRNIVGLLGFCFDKEEQMLVYEYISNGTLRESIHGQTGIRLDWRRRILIALGAAKGLNYLHEFANPPIIHRDVKSTNILLDERLVAMVADFGISRVVSDGGVRAGGQSHVTTQVKGTMGYLDPEYYMTLQLTEKSDIYSFGVVLLELITARPPIERGKNLVQEVKTVLELQGFRGFRHELMDPVLKQSMYITGFENLLNFALCCVEELPENRPSMDIVVKELESIVENERLLNSISTRI